MFNLLGKHFLRKLDKGKILVNPAGIQKFKWIECKLKWKFNIQKIINIWILENQLEEPSLFFGSWVVEISSLQAS